MDMPPAGFGNINPAEPASFANWCPGSTLLYIHKVCPAEIEEIGFLQNDIGTPGKYLQLIGLGEPGRSRGRIYICASVNNLI
jgi:hypothetical protein